MLLLLPLIYLAFVSLGLPDAALGAAWPAMYQPLNAGLSWAGGISMIIALGTIVSSLLSQRLNRALGTGRVTALSVALTAVSLLGFSASGSYWQLCLWAVPYGLGAGGVDAALNGYVALHYASRHMSWLHCMWGLGASIGPWIMGRVLAAGRTWSWGFHLLALIQLVLAAVLFLSLPMWKRDPADDGQEEKGPVLALSQVLAIPGAKQIMLTFFFYCSVEQIAGLWSGSFLVLHGGFAPEQGAQLAGLLFLGVMLGRALGGFLTIKLRDRQMIRCGAALGMAGAVLLLLGGNVIFCGAGLFIIGMGCAPVYPSLISLTPDAFGPQRARALIGVQMASAYTGTCLMPPLFGLLAQFVDVVLLPWILLAGLGWMLGMFGWAMRRAS